MYSLIPCIPILRVFFLLKMQKGCVYVNILLLILILFENCVFICEKGISNIFGLGRYKIDIQSFSFQFHKIIVNYLFKKAEVISKHCRESI